MSKRLPIFILSILAALFAVGVAELFKLRFETGDVYPEYSSLRADPLGTMALLESLQRSPGISVQRDFSANNRLPEGQGTTYLHLGARDHDWQQIPEDIFREIEGFAAGGGRLVITFLPEPTSWTKFTGVGTGPTPIAPGKGSPAKTNAPAQPKKQKSKTDGTGRLVSIEQRWGVRYGFKPLATSSEDSLVPARVVNQSDLPLPDKLEWHSGLILSNLTGSWRTIYARGTNPVLIERQFGRGSVVLATDSYYLSNEALLKDRQAALLAWLIGPSRRVVFDEAHFGIVETGGVAGLMRQYRLHGLAAALIGLAGLFIWKNSLSFVPPSPQERQLSNIVAGKEAAAGFVNLLRRNIPSGELLDLCFNQWTQSLGQTGALTIARIDRAQTVMESEKTRPPRTRDPVRAYKEICQALSSRTSRR